MAHNKTVISFQKVIYAATLEKQNGKKKNEYLKIN